MNLQWLNFASPFSPPRRSITFVRLLTTSLHHYQKPLPPLVIPPSSSFTENFLRGSGPGGQKIVRALFPSILFPVISSCAPSNNPFKKKIRTKLLPRYSFSTTPLESWLNPRPQGRKARIERLRDDCWRRNWS